MILLLTVEWNWIKAMGFDANKKDFMYHIYQLLDVQNPTGFICYVVNYRQAGLAGLIKLPPFRLAADSTIFKARDKLLAKVKNLTPSSVSESGSEQVDLAEEDDVNLRDGIQEEKSTDFNLASMDACAIKQTGSKLRL